MKRRSSLPAGFVRRQRWRILADHEEMCKQQGASPASLAGKRKCGCCLTGVHSGRTPDAQADTSEASGLSSDSDDDDDAVSTARQRVPRRSGGRPPGLPTGRRGGRRVRCAAQSFSTPSPEPSDSCDVISSGIALSLPGRTAQAAARLGGRHPEAGRRAEAQPGLAVRLDPAPDVQRGGAHVPDRLRAPARRVLPQQDHVVDGRPGGGLQVGRPFTVSDVTALISKSKIKPVRVETGPCQGAGSR